MEELGGDCLGPALKEFRGDPWGGTPCRALRESDPWGGLLLGRAWRGGRREASKAWGEDDSDVETGIPTRLTGRCLSGDIDTQCLLINLAPSVSFPSGADASIGSVPPREWCLA